MESLKTALKHEGNIVRSYHHRTQPKCGHTQLIDYADFTYIDMPAAKRKTLDVGNIFLNQGVAKCCGWVLRSKNRHHVAVCQCGKSSIDGGSWYIKVTGDIELKTVHYKDLHRSEFINA